MRAVANAMVFRAINIWVNATNPVNNLANTLIKITGSLGT